MSRIVLLLLLAVTSLSAQDHRVLLDLGPGSLSPDDPFTATFSFRGSIGWILSHKSALAFDYTRQSANRTTNEDLSRYARHFVGMSWQRAFSDAFYDEEHLQQQYLLSLRAGLLLRGRTRNIDPAQDLKTGLFFGGGLAIRYPLANRLAVMGTIEDDIGVLPRQAMKTYCATVNGTVTCYPSGGPNYYTFDVPRRIQHNFGLFVVAQWRP